MKVFLLSRGVPSKDDPQWGSFEYDQAKALKSMGHDVVILSLESRKKTVFKGFYIENKLTKEGIKHYNYVCGAIETISFINTLLYNRIIRYLFSFLYRKVSSQEGAPDIVYSHYSRNIAISVTVAEKIPVPIVGMEHLSELGKTVIKPAVLKRSRNCYPKLAQLLVVSEALKNNIKKQIGIESIVVPNIIGSEFQYKPTTRKDTCIRFLSTGNLLPIKRMDLIIKAFANLDKRLSNWDLTIVGGGVEMPKLKKFVGDNGLSDKIHIVGRKTRPEIVELINNTDVYILASTSETFGVAAAEALACGVPVIATDCGGPRDFITPENGIIIPVNDQQKMEEAIVYMSNNLKNYNKEEIAKDFHSKFSSEAVANQLTEIFEDVIKNKR